MGWFGLWGGSDSSEDALSKLDPKLREFLEKESPVKFRTPAAPPPPATKPKDAAAAAYTATSSSKQHWGTTTKPGGGDANQQDEGKPLVPKESLFQDGRYAHIWKTYRPFKELELEAKTPNDLILDVVDAFKDRRRRISSAAIENCSVEQEAWRNCFNHGDIKDRFTMCSQQVRQFDKCFSMQVRFLRVLGYSDKELEDQDPIAEEDKQIHSDRLWQRFKAHEVEVAAARAEGRPIPEFQVVPPSIPLAPELDPEEEERTRRNAIKRLKPFEVDAEMAARRADRIHRSNAASELNRLRDEEHYERVKRRKEGKMTALDRFWLWNVPVPDDWKPGDPKPGHDGV